MSEKAAKGKAEEKMKMKNMECFIGCYKQIIAFIFQLQHGTVHNSVMNDVKRFRSEGYPRKKSIAMAVHNNKLLWADMFDNEDKDRDDEDNDDETNDEEE
ncbi:hypothetical protein ACF0H5_009873 [Mactra antiquata]